MSERKVINKNDIKEDDWKSYAGYEIAMKRTFKSSVENSNYGLEFRLKKNNFLETEKEQ